jgi:hypothetical protein
MKLYRPLTAFCVALGCSAAAAPAADASVTANVTVRFATPLAATRYFAAAVNDGNLSALHQVTTPAAFRSVMGMRSEARDVQAQSCTATGRGDYNCLLSYQFRHHQGTSQWDVIVAPADSPGWYVYQYAAEGCGG